MIIFLVLACMCVFAGGKQDDPFAEIDLCIQQQNYTDALKLLNDYIIQNPKDFDNAQKRIDLVMKARTNYANRVDELLDVIVNEPTNDEKKLKMIAEVEALEKNPSASTKAFIAQTKAAAEFTFFRSQFETMMAEGSEHTKNQRYYESLLKNQEGFALYRENFANQGYDKFLVGSVENQLALINDEIKKFDGLQNRLKVAYADFNKATSEKNIPLAKARFEYLESVVNEYAISRNNIAKAGWFFKSSFEDLQKQYPDLTEASFLAFAYRFVLGRESDSMSGMLVALDTLWNSLLEEAKTNVVEQVANSFDETKNILAKLSSDFVAEKKPSLDEVLLTTSEFADLADKLNAFYELLNKNSEEFNAPQFPEFIQQIADARIVVDGFNSQFEKCVAFDDFNSQFNKIAVLQSDVEQIKNSNFDYVDTALSSINSFTLLKEDFNNSYNSTLAEFANSTNWQTSFQLIKDIFESNDSTLALNIQESWKNITNYLANSSSEITQNYVETYKECSDMLEQYPRELLPRIATVIAEIPPTVNTFNLALNYFENAPAFLNSDKTTISSNITRLLQLGNESLAIQTTANSRVMLASVAQNEAELRYNQAVDALRREDFANARDYIDRSRAKFLESLSYQEDAELRLSSDTRLIALGDQILRSENERVVVEVRELKTRAKNSYYAGNFEVADNLLSQAKIRWATTNTEDDPEIVSLLALVGTALSMKTGRTIPPTAPLYPEMSQILSIANQYYNEGRRLYNAGKRNEGKEVLNNAKSKLRELKTVYPLNQEASLLTLRIDQLIDPTSFNESFVQKVNNARTDYKDSSKQQTVYAELLDLYEINPAYPGLKDFIYNVEIELGIRAKPVDNSAKRIASQLTSEAKRLYDNNRQSEISLNVALERVNEALANDPDNTEAQTLKDRISIALGGSGTVVLTAEAEQQYQSAVQELQRGNILSAYAIVSRLMEDKTYSKASKIIDLKKRVDALL